MIVSVKRVPDGSNRNVIFVTAEWILPGCIVVIELNARLVKYVIDEDGNEIEAEPHPDDVRVDAPDNTNAVHVVTEPMTANQAPAAESEIPPTPPSSTIPPPLNMPIHVLPHVLPHVPPLVHPNPPNAPQNSLDNVNVAQIEHGRE